MSDRNVVRRGLWLGAVGAACAIWATGAVAAGGTKVPSGDQIKALIEKLYDGEIAPEDTAGREKIFIAVEKITSKDPKNLALKAPEFWVDAVQEGRFAGGKRKPGKVKELKAEDIDVVTKDAKPEDKPFKAKMWYRAGALVNATKPCPLLVTIVDKDTDPKTYLETAWIANDDIAKNWVVVAMAESDQFPLSKDSGVVGRPFAEIRDRFNTDANRWYLEGVGAACNGVQSAAAKFMSHRLAGLILRNPATAVTSVNTALFPTVVVHGKTVAAGAAVFGEYKKIDEKANAEIVVDDVPSVNALNDQVFAWIGLHPKRVMPTSSTFVTTITETEGEPWTGSLNIVAPEKRGEPTKVTVKYIRDSNTVDIQCENLGEFRLYMNDDLLDLDKEVAVFVNGTQLVKKVFERDLRSMIDIADTYGEWGRMFTARYRGVVPAKIVAPPAPPAPPVNPVPPGTPDPNAPVPPKPAEPPAPTPPAPTPPK